MAGRRRSRPTGQGMSPLFDLEPLTRHTEPAMENPPARARAVTPEQTAVDAAAPTPIEYWVRGIFRCGDGQVTHTIQAVGMSPHIDADVARFVHYLTTEGFQFVEGRGVLTQLLDVGSDDRILLAPVADGTVP